MFYYYYLAFVVIALLNDNWNRTMTISLCMNGIKKESWLETFHALILEQNFFLLKFLYFRGFYNRLVRGVCKKYEPVGQRKQTERERVKNILWLVQNLSKQLLHLFFRECSHHCYLSSLRADEQSVLYPVHKTPSRGKSEFCTAAFNSLFWNCCEPGHFLSWSRAWNSLGEGQHYMGGWSKSYQELMNVLDSSSSRVWTRVVLKENNFLVSASHIADSQWNTPILRAFHSSVPQWLLFQAP